MRVDWQAYLDDSLLPEERRQADDLLKESADARRELEGLKSFVSSVRSAALTEGVPLDRLSALMPAEKAAPQRRWLPRLTPLTGLAAAAVLVLVAYIGFFQDRRPALTLAANSGRTTDPVFASQWAAKKLSKSVPTMDLGHDAQLTFVHEGKGRCCFDYKFEGEMYHLNVRAERPLPEEPGEAISLDTGQRAYMSRGVRWFQAGYEMYLVGPNKQNSLKLANRATRLFPSKA